VLVDPDHFRKLDPDHLRKLDPHPDPHQSGKQDPDPQQSEKVEAFVWSNRGSKNRNSEWWGSAPHQMIRINVKRRTRIRINVMRIRKTGRNNKIGN
jgi:hypothetical protein